MIPEKPILLRIEYLEAKIAETEECLSAWSERKLYLKATFDHLKSSMAAHKKELGFLRQQHKLGNSLGLIK